MDVLICPECGAPMELKHSKKFNRPFYGCTRWRETGCTGGHGAHPDGRPLGIPANKATKAARIRAHAAFDRLWESGFIKRKSAYSWMQRVLEMTPDEAHIGRFTIEQCEKLIAVVEETIGVAK